MNEKEKAESLRILDWGTQTITFTMQQTTFPIGSFEEGRARKKDVAGDADAITQMLWNQSDRATAEFDDLLRHFVRLVLLWSADNLPRT